MNPSSSSATRAIGGISRVTETTPVVPPVYPAYPVSSRVMDPNSPLSEGLQSTPWPPNYKPIALPKFNRSTDPRQFIMSFVAVVASAGGNDYVMAKSFVIAAEGDALAWYSMLKPKTIYSWENLRDKNYIQFQGI